MRVKRPVCAKHLSNNQRTLGECRLQVPRPACQRRGDVCVSGSALSDVQERHERSCDVCTRASALLAARLLNTVVTYLPARVPPGSPRAGRQPSPAGAASLAFWAFLCPANAGAHCAQDGTVALCRWRQETRSWWL